MQPFGFGAATRFPLALLCFSLAFLGRGGALAAEPRAGLSPARQETLADLGVELTSLRLSANGCLVDFRYRVLDPTRAQALTTREYKPYLLDQSTGARLLIPTTAKLGPLRHTNQELTPGRVYFALFANPGRVVKPGSRVTLVLGERRLENLTVQSGLSKTP